MTRDHATLAAASLSRIARRERVARAEAVVADDWHADARLARDERDRRWAVEHYGTDNERRALRARDALDALGVRLRLLARTGDDARCIEAEALVEPLLDALRARS